MDIKEYLNFRTDIEERTDKILIKKNADYASDDNVLQFVEQPSKLGITPGQRVGVLLEKQVSALLERLNPNGKRESEPIGQRVSDIINFTFLAAAVIAKEEGHGVDGLYSAWTEGGNDNSHRPQFDINTGERIWEPEEEEQRTETRWPNAYDPNK